MLEKVVQVGQLAKCKVGLAIFGDDFLVSSEVLRNYHLQILRTVEQQSRTIRLDDGLRRVVFQEIVHPRHGDLRHRLFGQLLV